ncbi:MAG: hypothetical protein ACKO16_14750 [Gemmataceae bacterium]
MKNEQKTSQDMTQILPWLVIFRSFSLAFDTSKLLLAALGILTTATGWWLLSFIFTLGYDAKPPQWSASLYSKSANPWSTFKKEREAWNLMHLAAAVGGQNQAFEIEDLVETEDELNILKEVGLNPNELGVGLKTSLLVNEGKIKKERIDHVMAFLGTSKKRGLLTTWPWFEERGPNPYLLATGQSGIPWNTGRFWDWIIIEETPVLIEPLVKVIRPALLLIHPDATFAQRLYFISSLSWVIAVWSFFGGAISRIVVVQIARNENIGAFGALKYARENMANFVSAPLFCPMIAIFLFLVIMVFSLLGMIPVLGDIFISGLFWGVFLGLGLIMALVLVGLLGWPLMVATVSSEGLDSWESFSRGIQYLYSRAWNYISYNLLAVGYGIVVVFFIGFMASFGVYLAKWSVASTPFIQSTNRSPEYLFVYAPTSFGWRELLLQGAKVDGENIVVDGKVDQTAYRKYLGFDSETRSKKDSLAWWNIIGAILVAIWLGLFFLLVVGFGYSYYWCASTFIFLLLRKDLDNNEINELHIDDDEEEQFTSVLQKPDSTTPEMSPGAATNKSRSLPVVDAPPRNDEPEDKTN